MRKLCGIFIAILLSLPMFSEARNALLIANGNYSHFGNLSTPIKEARDLKISLTQLGFSVTIVENASREKILDSLSDFEKILKSKGGIALFHYGGHAVQVNGRNYLIPANADIPDERRVATRAVDVDELMHSMVADTNIVILDSCRNNPLPASSTRDGTRGLVMATNRPRNSIIVYSAQAGKTAKDGIFTPALTKKILEKKSFTDILMDVRREVRSVTKNEQSPCEYNELEMPVYLAGNASGEQNYTSQTYPVTSDSKTADEYLKMGRSALEVRDYGKAAECFLNSVDLGNTEAQLNLAKLYESGNGVPVNKEKAFELYKKAAFQNNEEAQYKIGLCYEYGRGIQKNERLAVEWYQKSANRGFEEACIRLGDCYHYGKGVEKNDSKAMEFYQKAANNGYAKGFYNLAWGYFCAWWGKKDYKKAVDMFKQSINTSKNPNECFAEQYHIAECYYSGGYGLKYDYEEAVKWFQKATNSYDLKGYAYPAADAYYRLGNCYYFGEGVSQNFKTALAYYKKSAEIAPTSKYDTHDDISKKSKYAVERLSSKSYSVPKWLFPLYGMELGKRELSTLLKKGGSLFGSSNMYELYGQKFFFDDNVLTSVSTNNSYSFEWMPEWKLAGYDPKLSYNEWISFLQKQEYTITEYEKPTVKKMIYDDGSVKYSLHAEVYGYREYPIKHRVRLSFGYSGNEKITDSYTINSMSVHFEK